MRRELWRVIRRSKSFYATTFRLSGSLLVFSLFINVVLGLAVWQTYLTKPKRHFYITNGVVPPTELFSMDAPNEGSSPLLANDPDAADDENILNLK
ncbi:MAG: phosphoesterase [Legionellaceae bacterium]|nr:phosphoesterase [Legionellaceae bacterium]